MTETSMPSNRAASATTLARTLVSGIRARALYPAAHPNVEGAVVCLHESLLAVDELDGFTLGVTPETLLVDGKPLDETGVHVTEAAQLLHELDIVRLTFSNQITPHTLHSLVGVLSQDITNLRGRGGPAHAWNEDGDGAVRIEQIDYHEILKDHDGERPERDRDNLWVHLVRAVGRRETTFNEAEQERLLEIAGSIGAIGDLAHEAIEPARTPDGAPLLTTQAMTVLAAYAHLHKVVGVMAPDRVDQLTSNLAAATTTLDPRVVVEMIRSAPDDHVRNTVVAGMVNAFDDEQVAQLLATTLALDGRATERLAEVFDTIAPDDERKDRVFELTKTMLNEHNFGGEDSFKDLWSSVDSLLISHDETPFVSSDYRTVLDSATSRAEGMAEGGLPPPELGGWIETVEEESVRTLSVTLLSDLLRIETDAVRGAEIARDIHSMVEDLLLTGEYGEALRLAQALAEAGARRGGVTREAARRALDELGAGAALREASALLEVLDEAEFDILRGIFAEVGPSAVVSLHAPLLFEKRTRARVRGGEIIVRYGDAAVSRLAPLTTHAQWFVRRNTAELLGRIGSPDAVPLLQPLLRGEDPRVLKEAVGALTRIDDPSAARAIHTVLRASSGGDRQAVIDALVEARDARVVPVLVRILKESEAIGPDHRLVLATLEALASVRDAAAVPVVASVIGQRTWFRRRRNRALKTTGVAVLVKIGGFQAEQALVTAATTGARLLRRIARETGTAQAS